MAQSDAPSGPDLKAGVALSEIPEDGVLGGHVDGEAVILARLGREIVAVAGHCSHYGGPLAKGLRVGETVRCPWHHACFSLRTGEALGAPAFTPLDRWKVEVKGRTVRVRAKDKPGKPEQVKGRHPKAVVIVGGGAAGFACAERLRRAGYKGRLTLLSADRDAPYDRPNLSKDYLAGSAPEDWMPLKGPEFYRAQKIDLRLGCEVVDLDLSGRRVMDAQGRRHPYDALLLATGGEPIRLTTPGFDGPNVFTLRSFEDCRRIIAAAKGAGRAVVVGASFISLECAAALTERGLKVDVVARETVLLEKVFGREIGEEVRRTHEAKGVSFHFGRTITAFQDGSVKLDDGSTLEAPLVIQGVGVKPRIELARAAGLTVDGGVVVDERLRASAPGVWAAGDIAAYPDPRSGERVRIEHWVHAEKQGQWVALDMLGKAGRYDATPFFWSNHFDLSIHYSGHAKSAEDREVDGSAEARDVAVRYREGARVAALATIGRNKADLCFAAEGEA